ncbi:hypothetical protein L2D00_14530 [Hyphomonadaceae bacterium BL14]|nr:hypothetical protein L2D00_14530 [Hyphomonadaceae bacterium BL14]
MKSIDTMIAKISQMSNIERKNLRSNAERIIEKDPDNADAKKLKAALDAVEPEISRKRIITGLLEWDPHEQGKSSFYGFFQGSSVARIFKRANHRNEDRSVYVLEIYGKKLGPYAHIENARDAGEKLFNPEKGL